MKDQIYEMLLEAADAVADKYYPKGKSKNRGQFLVAQALLHTELASRIEKFTEQVRKEGASIAADQINKELGLELTTNGQYYLNRAQLAPPKKQP